MSGIFENLGIDSGIIIIILLILVVFLLVRSISYNMRLSRLERRYKIFMKVIQMEDSTILLPVLIITVK